MQTFDSLLGRLGKSILLSECMTNPQESYPDMLNRLSQERSALLALEDDQPEFYKADPLLQRGLRALGR